MTPDTKIQIAVFRAKWTKRVWAAIEQVSLDNPKESVRYAVDEFTDELGNEARLHCETAAEFNAYYNCRVRRVRKRMGRPSKLA
jgi:hypothetical protein